MKRLAFGLFIVLANPGFVAAAEAPAAASDETASENASEAEAPAPEAPGREVDFTARPRDWTSPARLSAAAAKSAELCPEVNRASAEQ